MATQNVPCHNDDRVVNNAYQPQFRPSASPSCSSSFRAHTNSYTHPPPLRHSGRPSSPRTGEVNFCTYYDDKLHSAKAQKYCDFRRPTTTTSQHNNTLVLTTRDPHPAHRSQATDSFHMQEFWVAYQLLFRPQLNVRSCNLFTWVGMFQIPRQVCQLQGNVAGVSTRWTPRGWWGGVASWSQGA